MSTTSFSIKPIQCAKRLYVTIQVLYFIHSLITATLIMYELLGLQAPTKGKKTIQKKKKNIIIHRNVRERPFKNLGSKKRPWLKYIKEENKSNALCHRSLGS